MRSIIGFNLSIVVILQLLIGYSAFAKDCTSDTLYYLADNLRKSAEDKSVEIKKSGKYMFFTIRHPYFNSNKSQAFISFLDQRKVETEVGRLMLSSQQSLINFIKRHPNPDDYFYHALYFIVPAEKKYFIYRVHYLGDKENVTH